MIKPIDDIDVLNYFFDDRETFVVDFNPDLVSVVVNEGEVIFKLKGVRK